MSLNIQNNNIIILQTMEDRYLQMKEKARLRQARFYEKNKEKVNEKRRENTRLLNEFKQQQEPPSPPPLEPKAIKKPKKKTVIGYDEIITSLEQLKANNVIKSDGTLNKYKGDVKRLIQVTKCENINDCLKNPTEIIEIIDSSTFSINTKKSLYQTIVFLVDNLKLNYSKKIFDAYKKAFDIYKLKSLDLSTEKKKEIIISFTDYLERVKTHFGEDSKMWLIANLYYEVTMRDDFILQIVSRIKDASDENTNYIVTSTSQYTLIMNNYKTSNKYGALKIKLSKSLSSLIKQYITATNLNIGDYLFGDKKLSNYITTHNKLIDVDDGINFYRHAKITEEFSEKDLSAEERVELAAKMNHSPIVQLRYLRNQ